MWICYLQHHVCRIWHDVLCLLFWHICPRIKNYHWCQIKWSYNARSMHILWSVLLYITSIVFSYQCQLVGPFDSTVHCAGLYCLSYFCWPVFMTLNHCHCSVIRIIHFPTIRSRFHSVKVQFDFDFEGAQGPAPPGRSSLEAQRGRKTTWIKIVRYLVRPWEPCSLSVS